MAILDFNQWDSERLANFRDLFGSLIGLTFDNYSTDFDPLDDVIFEMIISEYVRPEFLSYPESKRRLMLDASEYVENLTYAEFLHFWEGLLPPFDLNESNWKRFLQAVSRKLYSDTIS